MRHRAGSTPRRGFTMVELLVVIAIIVVLVALTLSGISVVRHSARQTQTVNDIRGLDEAATSFKNKFGFFPPSHVSEIATDNTGPYIRQFRVPNNIYQAEYRVLRKMYPRWDPANTPGAVDASGNILPASNLLPARAGEILDNNQVMVYFLGGPTNQGWSNAGPFAPSPTGNSKIAPFYEFPVGDQLVQVGTAAHRFHDHYGIPYAYFSSNTDNDRYDPRSQFPWASSGTTRTFSGWPTPLEIALPVFDPATDPNIAPNATYPNGQGTKTNTAHPLRSPGGKWLAAGRVQIISAGRDKQFGFGSALLTLTPPVGSDGIIDYTPGSGNYQLKAPGDDDLSNFSGSMLGVGQ